MRSYQTARSLYSFLGFLAWCVIGLGGIAAFLAGTAAISLSRDPGLPGLLLATSPGLLLALAGLFGLAMVQMGRTGVDGAEYAQQSLAISREQLDIAKQLLANATRRPAKPTYAGQAAQAAAPDAGFADANTDTAPSYAARSDPASAASPDPISTGADTALTSTTNPPLPQPAPAALPNKPIEITYQNGRFRVGEQLFRSKDDALEHQRELLALPTTSAP